MEGAEYHAARRAADKENKALHNAAKKALKGLDIHEVHPVKFGGSPTDLVNKIFLTRSEHSPLTGTSYNGTWSANDDP